MKEGTAKVIAGVAALAVGLLAVFVVIYPGVRDLPIGDDVYARRAVTDRVVTDGPNGRTVTETTKEAGDSTLERVLGDGGILLVRIGVAAAAAFLAGAVVQRILLGRYGGKATGLELEDVTSGVADLAGAVIQRVLLGHSGAKAAGVELEDVTSTVVASTDALEELAHLVDEVGTKLSDALRTSADALRVAAETSLRVDELDTGD